MQDPSPLANFDKLSVIGRGTYAKVTLVRKQANKRLYALKSMNKKFIQKKGQAHRIIMERNILTQINHPFLIKIDSAFQNDRKLYLVLQYCPGGQLFGLLYKRKRLSEAHARFYAAQVLLALEYLHSKNIIYRDLKPENILICEDGYIKLTDFGLSKSNIEGDYDTFSICGTPQYLAPQVINKAGHGRAVDWWCFGSILYQLIAGQPPFYCKNRGQLSNLINNTQPEMNPNWSKNLRDLFSKLFQKQPEERIKHIPTLKEHPWFAKVNFQEILKKSIKPPFVPLINHQEDVSNFAHQFTKCDVDSDHNDSIDSDNDFQGFSFERKASVSSPVLTGLSLSLQQIKSAQQLQLQMVIDQVGKMLC